MRKWTKCSKSVSKALISNCETCYFRDMLFSSLKHIPAVYQNRLSLQNRQLVVVIASIFVVGCTI